MRSEVLFPGMGIRTLGWVMCTKERRLSGLKTITRTLKDKFKDWRRWKIESAMVWTYHSFA